MLRIHLPSVEAKAMMSSSDNFLPATLLLVYGTQRNESLQLFSMDCRWSWLLALIDTTKVQPPPEKKPKHDYQLMAI